MKGWDGRGPVPTIGRILEIDWMRNCADCCGQDFCDNWTVFRGTFTECLRLIVINPRICSFPGN